MHHARLLKLKIKAARVTRAASSICRLQLVLHSSHPVKQLAIETAISHLWIREATGPRAARLNCEEQMLKTDGNTSGDWGEERNLCGQRKGRLLTGYNRPFSCQRANREVAAGVVSYRHRTATSLLNTSR